MESLAPLGAILALAFLAEGLTEYFFSGLLTAKGIDTKYLRYIAALIGVALSLTYSLDILEDLLGISAGIPVLGKVLTGLILGRGSNFVHDFYSSYVKKAIRR